MTATTFPRLKSAGLQGAKVVGREQLIKGSNNDLVATLIRYAEGESGDIGAACRDAADTIIGVMSACARIRRAYLRHLQAENNCSRTGKPCREQSKCGCHLELQESLNGVGQGSGS